MQRRHPGTVEAEVMGPVETQPAVVVAPEVSLVEVDVASRSDPSQPLVDLPVVVADQGRVNVARLEPQLAGDGLARKELEAPVIAPGRRRRAGSIQKPGRITGTVVVELAVDVVVHRAVVEVAARIPPVGPRIDDRASVSVVLTRIEIAPILHDAAEAAVGPLETHRE